MVRCVKLTIAMFLEGVLRAHDSVVMSWFYLSNNPEVVERLSYYYQYSRHNPKKAIIAAKRLLELDPESIYARHMLACIYLETDQYDKAEEYCLEIIERDKNHYSANRLFGQCCLIKEKYDQALLVFTNLVNLYPDKADAHIYLATTYNMMNNHNKEMKVLKNALALHPENEEIKTRIEGMPQYQNENAENQKEE